MWKKLILSLLATGGSFPASAHIFFVHNPLPVETAGVVNLFFGEECGESATTGVTMTVPKGFSYFRPVAKSGWTITTRYDAPKPKGEDDRVPVSVTWRGGPLAAGTGELLPIMLLAPDKPGTIPMDVTIHCRTGDVKWTDRYDPARPTFEPEYPAPTIEVTPATVTG